MVELAGLIGGGGDAVGGDRISPWGFPAGSVLGINEFMINWRLSNFELNRGMGGMG